MTTRPLSILCSFIAATLVAQAMAAPAEDAREILDVAGVKGGLVVHLGCGDGKLTAALRPTDAYMVHGLDRDPANVPRARAYVASLGTYGKVTIDQWRGSKLPYIDNMVNLIVAEKLAGETKGDAMRVLAPRGVLCVKQDGKWTTTTKPVPDEIDEWTHFLHDADNNAGRIKGSGVFTLACRDKDSRPLYLD